MCFFLRCVRKKLIFCALCIRSIQCYTVMSNFMQVLRLRDELADAEKSLQAIIEAKMTGSTAHKIAVSNVQRITAELQKIEPKAVSQ